MQALAYINNKPYYLFKIFLQGQMAKMQEWAQESFFLLFLNLKFLRHLLVPALCLHL